MLHKYLRESVVLGLAGILVIASGAIMAHAGEADVVDVKATRLGTNIFRFDVTVRHADTGWKHYANGWEVLGPDGKVLGKRTLYHPHVNEQPFKRSLSGVKIPSEINVVTVRAHDSVHGNGGREMQVRLPR